MSTSQKRDADMDRLLRAVLQPASQEPAGGCPDANLLAAFVEGTLSAPEQATLDAHIVGCGRCQEALAVLSHDLPHEEAEAPAKGWFTWVTQPRLRWLVPISAAATIAVVFFATRPVIAPGDITAPVEVTQLAQAPPSTPAPAEAALERDKATTIPAKSEPEPPSRLKAENRQADQAVGSKQVADAAPTSIPVGQKAVEEKAAAETATNRAGRVGVDEKRAQAAAEAAALPLAAAPPAPAASDVASKAGAAPKTPAADTMRAMPAMPSMREELGRMEPTAIVSAAPDGTVRWRLGPGGRIWRSLDAGSTWHWQLSGVSANLVAGSAPSATTCWAVGAAGVVLLTVDGEGWRLLPFPVSVDLVAVQATNALVATVTTSDGRRFETRDAGLTWSRKQ